MDRFGFASASSAGDAAPAAQPEYTLPGVMHFLQQEWRRFETARNAWAVERVQLTVRRGPAVGPAERRPAPPTNRGDRAQGVSSRLLGPGRHAGGRTAQL